MRRQVVLLLMSTVVLGFHAQAKAGRGGIDLG